jgi:alpha-D-xyloside xylohydrolase
MKDHPSSILNHPVDVSVDFSKMENFFFLPWKMDKFDAAKGEGTVVWKSFLPLLRTAFDQVGFTLHESDPYEFPSVYGGAERPLPFSVSFHGPRTLRLRVASKLPLPKPEKSLMLAREPKPTKEWKVVKTKDGVTYQGPHGSLCVKNDPWAIELRDAAGRLLTKTQHMKDNRSLRNSDPLPFSFIRRCEDGGRRFAATFTLAPEEKIYGCGESFTRLNKRGQKVPLWAYDCHGVQHDGMYKPVPFFLSDRGYGCFAHSTSAMTFDFGKAYDACTTLYTADEYLDLFFFLGDPKDIVSEYTALTGRSPMPPLWSFGLWMSRCTYKSEAEARTVAKKFRAADIPLDVIHLDTGWFEDDWCCDYEFSTTRFTNPKKMIQDLKKDGYNICLWQLPYFTPGNRLFKELVDKDLVVKSPNGTLPTDDAILDFSNPKTVAWYQGHIKHLLDLGVGAIKVDFGEAAPLNASYASGKTGLFEHNLYPLRYNKAVAEVTHKTTGENIIWARSAWAGSQRYPLHWGGDAETNDGGMIGSLRGGLSLGLCGFTFWSHDIGGFVKSPPVDLYRRWMPFGMLTSHSRCHGVPPREPFGYGKAFVDEFRAMTELKYKLMPYVYAQAKDSSEKGYPMLRTLFFEYPEDPTTWLIEDEYLFGADILVAPLFEDVKQRRVYLPPGTWVDYQSGAEYRGGHWYSMAPGPIPCAILVRSGALIPHIALAQSTAFMDWSKIELRTYGPSPHAEGLLCLPQDDKLITLEALHRDGAWKLVKGKAPAKVKLSFQ